MHEPVLEQALLACTERRDFVRASSVMIIVTLEQLSSEMRVYRNNSEAFARFGLSIFKIVKILVKRGEGGGVKP